MKVATVNKSYEEAIRKRIADEGLPIEVRPSLCTATCSGKCEHQNCIEIWTWIPERVYEFDKIVGEIVMVQTRTLFINPRAYKLELDNKPSIYDEPKLNYKMWAALIRKTLPNVIAKEILEATEIERSWAPYNIIS